MWGGDASLVYNTTSVHARTGKSVSCNPSTPTPPPPAPGAPYTRRMHARSYRAPYTATGPPLPLPMHILHRCTRRRTYIYTHTRIYDATTTTAVVVVGGGIATAAGNLRNKIYIVEDVRDFIVQNLNRSAW